MPKSQPAILYFAPDDLYVAAKIVPLTPEMADQVMREWWRHPALKRRFKKAPIDRHWEWRDAVIEYEDRLLRSEKLAIVTGDGTVQGIMLVSTEGVSSELSRGATSLFVELLFTAPANRPELRADGRSYYCGIGTALLRHEATLSRKLGHSGRLKLDASPDFVTWYQRRGLQKLKANPIVFEGVEYTPMELSAEAADHLLDPSPAPPKE